MAAYRNHFYIFFIFAAVLMIAAFIALASRAPSPQYFDSVTPEAAGAHIELIRVQKPYFVVYGTNLDTVEVWAIPSGTGIRENEHMKLGNARVVAHERDNLAIWAVDIPAVPLLVTEIYAKGFYRGRHVGTVTLPLSGASALYDALWKVASPPGSPQFDPS